MKLRSLNDVFFAAFCDVMGFKWKYAKPQDVHYMRSQWEQNMCAAGFNLEDGAKAEFTHEEGLEKLKIISAGIGPSSDKIMSQLNAQRDVDLN